MEPEPEQNEGSERPVPARTTGRRGERPPLLGAVLGLAILAAPFLALPYGLDAGLSVMALALAAVGLLAVLTARAAEPDVRQRLYVVAAVNAVLALACLVLLIVRQ